MILLELDALDAYDMLLPCKGVEVPHASIQKLLLEDILQVVVLLRNLPRTNHLSDTLQTLETCQIPLDKATIFSKHHNHV